MFTGKEIGQIDAAASKHFALKSTGPRLSDVATVEEVLSFANTLASRVVVLADAACGSVPQASCGSDSCGEDGVMPRLVHSAQHTRGRLGDAMEALSRIERSLGVVA